MLPARIIVGKEQRKPIWYHALEVSEADGCARSRSHHAWANVHRQVTSILAPPSLIVLYWIVSARLRYHRNQRLLRIGAAAAGHPPGAKSARHSTAAMQATPPPQPVLPNPPTGSSIGHGVAPAGAAAPEAAAPSHELR